MLALQRAIGKPFRIGADDLKSYNEGDAAGDVINEDHFTPSTIAGGEYGPLARWANCTVIDPVIAGMNILDPELRMTVAQQHAMLSMIVMQLRGDDSGLPDYWDSALATGLECLHMLPKDQQTYKKLIEIINTDPDEHEDLWPKINGKRQRISPASDYTTATSKLSDVLKRLEGGPYGQMFNGTASIASALQQRVVVFDYSKLDDVPIAMVQTILWHIRAAALANKDASLEVNIGVFDEAHRLWRIPAFAKAMAHYIKVIRALGHLVMMSTQRVSDLHTTGSPLASNAFGDFAMVVTFKLKHDEARKLQDLLGFSDTVRKRIENFEKGECFILIEGQEPCYVLIPRTDLTMQIGETDQASAINVRLDMEGDSVHL
jgi:hypothetical protein